MCQSVCPHSCQCQAQCQAQCKQQTQAHDLMLRRPIQGQCRRALETAAVPVAVPLTQCVNQCVNQTSPQSSHTLTRTSDCFTPDGDSQGGHLEAPTDGLCRYQQYGAEFAINFGAGDEVLITTTGNKTTTGNEENCPGGRAGDEKTHIRSYYAAEQNTATTEQSCAHATELQLQCPPQLINVNLNVNLSLSVNLTDRGSRPEATAGRVHERTNARTNFGTSFESDASLYTSEPFLSGSGSGSSSSSGRASASASASASDNSSTGSECTHFSLPRSSSNLLNDVSKLPEDITEVANLSKVLRRGSLTLLTKGEERDCSKKN